MDYDYNKTAWYTICLIRYSTITDNNPSIYWPSIMLQSAYSNQCGKYPHLSDVLIYTWNLLRFFPSWERDPSRGSLRFRCSFYPVKRWFFCSFFLLLLRVEGRGCHSLLKHYETNCDWLPVFNKLFFNSTVLFGPVQIKLDWIKIKRYKPSDIKLPSIIFIFQSHWTMLNFLVVIVFYHTASQ